MPSRFSSWCRRICLLSPLLVAAVWLSPAAAQDEPVRNQLVFTVNSKNTSLTMMEKTSRVIALNTRIKTVDGFDPDVLKVTTISDPERAEYNDPRKIRVQAVTPGLTSLTLVDENGDSFSVEVLVAGDTKHLEAMIRRAFPDSSVHAVKVKESVLLLGWVNQPDQLTPIVEVAEQYHPKVLNYLRVSGSQQVMLQVKIMEVQRGKIRTLGFNFLNVRDGSYVSSMPGNIATLGTLAVPFGGPASLAGQPGNATATFGLVSQDNIFQGFLEALKQEAMLKILAEPTLVTVNGRPANFLSGGEFPILVPGGLGTVTVQFKPFGVRLEFVPIVLGNGRVRLEVSPEVSEKDFTNQVTVGTTVVPGLTTRRANAQVEMNFGQTLVIAGLINNRIQTRTQKVPFLGELPWVGAAFRRVSHDESETELLIMVTPQLVEPLDPSQVPEYGPGQNTVAPTDSELFGNGYVEVPRYAPDPVEIYDGADAQGDGAGAPGMMVPGGISTPPASMTPAPNPAGATVPAPAPPSPAIPDAPPPQTRNETEAAPPSASRSSGSRKRTTGARSIPENAEDPGFVDLPPSPDGIGPQTRSRTTTPGRTSASGTRSGGGNSRSGIQQTGGEMYLNPKGGFVEPRGGVVQAGGQSAPRGTNGGRTPPRRPGPVAP